jgi:recombinational DNA repair protein (RecF pathway)
MLIFKSSWIILKIHKVNEKDFLYTIFTQEYGKIMCQKKFSKTEKSLDIGYLIQFEIETKEWKKVHKMRNIKILSDFSPTNKSFDVLQNYLELLALIHQNTPEWVQAYGIIDIIEVIHNYENITADKLFLAKLKLLYIFWNLPYEDQNQTINKLLIYIHNKKISEIFKLWKIPEEIKKDLKEFL